MRYPRTQEEASMIYEMRTYHAMPGKLRAVVQRFGDVTHAIFLRHGFRPVGYWTESVGDNTKFHYMLAWEDDAERRANGRHSETTQSAHAPSPSRRRTGSSSRGSRTRSGRQRPSRRSFLRRGHGSRGDFERYNRAMRRSVPRGAVVAQQTLDLLTLVRIQAGQPGCALRVRQG